jgi:putative phosphoribosyl transferase
MGFRNRTEAGKKLGEVLGTFREESPLVLAIPRGGVPVAAAVAHELAAPMELLVVRRITPPGNPEAAVGGITEEGFYWMDHSALDRLGLPAEKVHPSVMERGREVDAWVRKLRRGRPLPRLKDRTIIVVDDGISSGISAIVAARFLRTLGVARLVLAVPIASRRAVRILESHYDQVVVDQQPEPFGLTSDHYREFPEVSDAEILRLVGGGRKPPPVEHEFRVVAGAATLEGTLTVPSDPKGLVLFAHGSGSGRLSPRNQAVARSLVEKGIATLLFDLLTAEEGHSQARVFDVALLARRLERATRQIRIEGGALIGREELPIGYFGASTGAAAALIAAADLGRAIDAVVCRGGRVDLARSRWENVKCPVLLLVGGNDTPVLELNQLATEQISRSELEIIPGASHLFEESGALEKVSEISARFFLRVFIREMSQAA